MSVDRRTFIIATITGTLAACSEESPDPKTEFETTFDRTFLELQSKQDGFALEMDNTYAAFNYEASTTQGQILMLKGLFPPPSFETPDIFDPKSFNVDETGRILAVYEQTYSNPDKYVLGVLASSSKHPITFY